MTIPLVIGVNPLQTTLFERGIVSGRVALLLRSAEIQPVFVRFVSLREQSRIPSQLLAAPRSREGLAWCWALCRVLAKYSPSGSPDFLTVLCVYPILPLSREGSGRAQAASSAPSTRVPCVRVGCCRCALCRFPTMMFRVQGGFGQFGFVPR